VIQFGVECILFTGVAGGLKEDQKVGDLVIAVRKEGPMKYSFFFFFPFFFFFLFPGCAH